VVTLLATFDLVKECSLLVHGSSKFSEMLWFLMKGENAKAKQRRVDANGPIHSPDHSASEFELLKRLNAMREGQNGTSSLQVTRPDRLGNAASSDGLIIVNILGLLANDLVSSIVKSFTILNNLCLILDYVLHSFTYYSLKQHLQLE
jgi:hypothetical protein